ncbi:MAG: hypothetical protein R2827_00875 [Bdellovibrionales bacterium]
MITITTIRIISKGFHAKSIGTTSTGSNHSTSRLKALAEGANPIAAFDADNTLWNIDVGETYFQYLIDNELVELPQDPWEYYHSLRNGPNPPEGYLWLAQIMKGTP